MGGLVESPVSETEARAMTDRQWIDAMKTHDRNGTSWCNGGVYGGALQLSRILEEEVRNDPERFATLALGLDKETNPDYFRAVLRGIAKTDLDCQRKLKVCSYCHKMSSKPYGSQIVDVSSQEPLR